jgi:hypothetical protein
MAAADVMAITKWSIASPAHTVALSLSDPIGEFTSEDALIHQHPVIDCVGLAPARCQWK